MPEVKNTFIQSKMNKDMDGRIIPNGQYRDGQNVQISRSEGDDVGALENVLGNELLSNFGLTNSNLEIIGHLTNDTLDCIFLLDCLQKIYLSHHRFFFFHNIFLK